MNLLLALAGGAVTAVILAIVFSRPTPDDGGEGVPWDWGDPYSAGWRPSIPQAERKRLARQWREKGKFEL